MLVDDILGFLRSNRSQSDITREVKKDNVHRELKGYKEGIREKDGQKYCSLTSFYRYCFHHYDAFDICKTICSEITLQTLSSANTLDSAEGEKIQDKSTLNLYHTLIRSNILDDVPNDYIPSSEQDIRYVVNEYKYIPEFKENNNWNKILLFEEQFQNISSATDRTNFETLIKKKWEFLNLCISMKDSGILCNRMASLVCQKNSARKHAAEVLDGIVIEISQIRHRPEILEQSVVHECNTYRQIDLTEQVVCLNCTQKCNHDPGVHVYIGWKHEKDFSKLGDVTTLTMSIIEKQHHVNVTEIVFISPEAVTSTENNIMRRYELQDNIDRYFQAGKIFHIYRNLDMMSIDTPRDEILHNNLCLRCFGNISDTVQNPLHIDTFNLIQEWNRSVPLPIQTFLKSAFINRVSLQMKAPNDHSFLNSKLSSLFCIWEGLLNTLNRSYIGFVQDLNTDELLVNYHNITTVFNITAHSGITQSLRSGNRRLKKKSDPELCNFNTFHKKYPLKYTKNGESSSTYHQISLRECHLVFMMDNLVHLSTKTDPLPGESKTNQICTLPLTFKGIPVDSKIVSDWHDDTCDKTADCECLKPVNLHQEDIDTVLLSPTDAEVAAADQLNLHSRWGIVCLWKELMKLDQPILEAEKDHRTLSVDTKPVDIPSANEPDMELQHTDDFFETSFSFDTEGACTIAHECEDNIRQILDTIETYEVSEAVQIFDVYTYFKKPVPLPLLCRHPPPASGKDDDIMVLKNILDDVITKANLPQKHRILFGPDFKIANNVFKLMEQSQKYHCILPEFPVLHLRKSKITNLISAYKSCGLIHILQYMKDEDTEKDWTKLLSIDNIEKATRNIWRLATALQIAFMTAFYESLTEMQKEEFNSCVNSILPAVKMEELWGIRYKKYIQERCQNNATFCLHYEILSHCNEIVAIAVAERVGGVDGYNLLLASVKSSLRFSFLNGASSYAGFCVRLLIEHYKTSHFHKNMKMTLFSTPHNDSDVNFGLDTAREIDHRIAKKCIRPGSTLDSILPKMCTVDDQQKVHCMRKQLLLKHSIDPIEELTDSDTVETTSAKYMGKQVSSTDKKHIFRTTKLILRQGGVAPHNDDAVWNVYQSSPEELSNSILDRETENIGTYLIKKFVAQTNLLGMTENDVPSKNDLQGPKVLVSRVKQAKGVTISRSRTKHESKGKTEIETTENKRKKKVDKMSKIFDCLSSSMNTCQAVFRSDGTKASTNKSLGVKKALNCLLNKCTTTEPDRFILSNFKRTPDQIRATAKKVVVEFAGTKFKMMSTTGNQYIQYINKGIINFLLTSLPSTDHIIICEEKYKFTPDDLKANTRQKRQKKKAVTIAHLKQESEIISESKLSKKAIVSTTVGKSLISSYLSKHVDLLDVRKNLTLDIDSEAVMCTCYCGNSNDVSCSCKPYAVPMRFKFSDGKLLEKTTLTGIKQRKGEAEMSVVDWFPDLQQELAVGDSVVSYITSADIDTVLIHMFALSLYWERDETGNFKWPVYVWLQKQKSEIYDITGIILSVEKYFDIDNVAAVIALVLCMGGNDFLPNFHNISHDKLLSVVVSDKAILKDLFKFQKAEGKCVCTINENVYVDVIKRLYCPVNLQHSALAPDEVRQLSIKPPNKDFRHPQSWMPPVSALQTLAKLIQCQIDYFLTCWDHGALMPDFLSYGCISRTDTGDLIYTMGPDMHTDDKTTLLHLSDEDLAAAVSRAKIVRKKICS